MLQLVHEHRYTPSGCTAELWDRPIVGWIALIEPLTEVDDGNVCFAKISLYLPLDLGAANIAPRTRIVDRYESQL
jgi:hypothetical protein